MKRMNKDPCIEHSQKSLRSEDLEGLTEEPGSLRWVLINAEQIVRAADREAKNRGVRLRRREIEDIAKVVLEAIVNMRVKPE